MMTKSKITKWSIAALIVLLSSSCSRDTIYHTFHTLPLKGWERDSILNFEFEIDSVSTQCGIDIDLNYNGEYPYSNLYLFVSISDTLKELFADTINIQLADKYGKWLGDGWGTTYQQRVEYKRDYNFKQEGLYYITIKQGMRDNPIRSIERVGLRINRKNVN